MRFSLQKWQNTFDAISDIVCVLSINHEFLEINKAGCDSFGLKKEEILGKKCYEIIHKRLSPIGVCPCNASLNTRSEAVAEYKEGDRYYALTAWPITNNKDEIVAFVHIVKDITERKQAEEALRKLNEELEHRVGERTTELKAINRALQESLETLQRTQNQLVQSEKMAALGGLVAGVAHEINTPLGVGVTAASHLAEQSQEIERHYQNGKMTRLELERYLTITHKSTTMILENLRRAAENIKSFKQVAVDQAHDTKRLFSLKQCIDNVLLSLHPKLKNTQHTVTVLCPEDLEIDSYPGAFSQVITNFVMNSLIHGFEHKTQGEIVLEVSLVKGKLHIQYHDNGKGISQKEQTRIFEPFYTTKRSQGGTGLGLHIVYNLVTQRLNGHIECESTPGEGTTFTIQIPLEGEKYE